MLQGEVGQMGLVGEACVVTDLSARRSAAFVLLADVVVGKVGARRCGQLIEHSGGGVGDSAVSYRGRLGPRRGTGSRPPIPTLAGSWPSPRLLKRHPKLQNTCQIRN